MNLFLLVTLISIICQVSCIDLLNGISNQVLHELFERASRQIATELTMNLKEILAKNKLTLLIHKRSVVYDNQTKNGEDYPTLMTQCTDESKVAQNQYMIGLKVIKFLSKSSVLNVTQHENFDMKTPPDFCPFKFNTISCDQLQKYRTIDGSCNNLKVSLLGKSFTPYKRYLPSDYDDGIDTPRKRAKNGELLPNPRYISLNIHQPSDSDSILSNLGVMFGQFVDHDFAFTSVSTKSDGTPVKCTCNSADSDCINISTPSMDTVNSDQKCMRLTRSGASFKDFECKLNSREQLNAQTHFLDLSALYGSSLEQANKLRRFRKGLLKYRRVKGLKGQFMPAAKAGICLQESKRRLCFETGDSRTNQNLLLVSLHNLWFREHNRIARRLRKINRHWNDETLYQEARRINIAVYQNIIYSEWLPIIIGKDLIKKFNLGITKNNYFFGYNTKTNPSLAGEFSGAAYRFGHSLITSFYSKCDNDLNIYQNISLGTIMFKPREAYISGGLDALSRGLLFETGSKMDSHITDAVQNRLFENINAAETHRFSLSAVNIMRGRDHGLPGYNKFRKLAGLREAKTFEDLLEIPFDTREKLMKIYQDVNDIDAFTGGVSEAPLAGAIIGPTFAYIVGRQFKELKEGDRFYFENGNSVRTRFSPAQMEEIKKVTMAGIMCNNLDLNIVQPRAFEALNRRNAPVDCSRTPRINLKKWRNEIL